MPSNNSAEPRRRRTGVSRKKQLSKRTTGSKLWLADEKVFDEVVGRKNSISAQLLREIVHEWATNMRVSGQAQDGADAAGPIRRLHREIIAQEMAPLRETLATILALLSDEDSRRVLAQANTPDSTLLLLIEKLTAELKANKEELQELRALATAHYLLSGQSFANTWSLLSFLQRYLVVPSLQTDPARTKDSLQIATTERDDARREGLTLVEQMNIELDIHNPLINPGRQT
jgi:two-component sensor histidine kinase